MPGAPTPRMHGLTHVPGGPDPIPGLNGGGGALEWSDVGALTTIVYGLESCTPSGTLNERTTTPVGSGTGPYGPVSGWNIPWGLLGDTVGGGWGIETYGTAPNVTSMVTFGEKGRYLILLKAQFGSGLSSSPGVNQIAYIETKLHRKNSSGVWSENNGLTEGINANGGVLMNDEYVNPIPGYWGSPTSGPEYAHRFALLYASFGPGTDSFQNMGVSLQIWNAPMTNDNIIQGFGYVIRLSKR